jgi:hypothetical protein
VGPLRTAPAARLRGMVSALLDASQRHRDATQISSDAHHSTEPFDADAAAACLQTLWPRKKLDESILFRVRLPAAVLPAAHCRASFEFGADAGNTGL